MKIKYIIVSMIFVIILAMTFFLRNNSSHKDHVKIPILLYHDFVPIVPEKDPDNFNYINTPQSFEENIKTLLADGYTFLSFQDLDDTLNNKKELPEKPILINMDDGYESNYKYIYPILKKYNVKASIFIVTNHIGKTVHGKKYLTWKQCNEMENSNLVEIFSHSKKHVFYDKRSVRELRDDVIESYQVIEKELGNKNLKYLPILMEHIQENLGGF